MVTPGAWYVELDDGTGADRRVELPGEQELVMFQVIEAYGRQWRLVDVQPMPRYARAVPTEQPTPPSGRG